MSSEEHLQVLKEKHADLDELIRQEEMRPPPGHWIDNAAKTAEAQIEGRDG